MTSSPLRTARVAYCPGLKPTGRSGSNTKRSRSFENAVRSTSRALMNGLRLSKGSSREEWPPDRRTVSSSRDRRQLACSVEPLAAAQHGERDHDRDRKSTRLNSSHLVISYAVFCSKNNNKIIRII